MSDGSIIFPLALVTLVIVLALVAWQWSRARRARRNHETSNLTHPEAPAERKSTSL